MAPAVVTWADIGWWALLTGRSPRPWETRGIIMLSVVRANIIADHQRREFEKNAKR